MFVPAMILAASGGSCTFASSPSHQQEQNLAIKVANQAQVLTAKIRTISAATQSKSSKAETPKTSQIKDLIQDTQKYFSARTAYQKVLFHTMMSDNPPLLFPDNAPLAKSGFTALKTPRVSEVLLPIFQKYFSASISHLSYSQLVARRKLLYQLAALDKGQLSGPVWLYDSPLAGFATARLAGFDKRFLALASHYREAHRYSQAENIYRKLLQGASPSHETNTLKVLLTRCIVDDYNYRSRREINKHKFKSARAYLRKIIDRYPKTRYAAAAQKQLKKTVPIAVKYFHEMGDKNWHPEHIFVAQTKAAEFYEKAYKEDPDGPQSDLMLYDWAKAQASIGGKVPLSVKLMKRWLKKYPENDPLRPKATYLLAFYYSSAATGKYAKGAKWMKLVTKKWPKSPLAAEAVWHTAFDYLAAGDFKPKGYRDGLPYLEKYYKDYPQAPRWIHAKPWIEIFKKRMK